MKRRLAIALSVLITTSVFAQTDSQSPKPKSARKSSSAAPVSKQLEDMKDAISAQQQQIMQLQQQVQNRDQAIQTLQKEVTDAQATAAAAQQTANAAVPKAEDLDKQYFDPLQHDVADLKTVSGNTVNELQETQKRVAGLESPLAIHYKGILITPGGFLAGETYWRNRATAGEATAFNSIPFGGASQANLAEIYGSGRQSRISILAQGKEGNVSGTGYYEADFLSAGVTSNNNQTDSYVLRQRQAYAQAVLANGWTFTGGQMWTLLTETKKGVDNRTEATPMTIDPNYNVGFTFARQYGFRVSKNFNNKFWLAGSIENSQINAPGVTNNAANYLLGSAGNGGGLYNTTANYAFNRVPDFVFKGVLEPGIGHYEAFVLISDFRDRIFPDATLKVPSAAGAFNASTVALGFGANARWSMMSKHVDFGLHFFGGNGVGRYGASGLPDLTISENGNIGKIRNIQALGTLEYHNPKWDLYMYAGDEYEYRRWDFNAKGQPEGYGSPLFANYGCSIETLPGAGGFSPGSLTNCAGNTRNLIEGTFGFWYKFYNGPKGRLQMGSQFSYIVRDTWVGYNSASKPVTFGDTPTANDTLWATSFRYYLP